MGVKKGNLFAVLSLLIISFIFTIPVSALIEEDTKPVFKKAIYFVMQDSKGKYQIGIMNEDGSKKEILTSSGNNWSPCVDPAGNKIAMFSDRSGSVNLYIMNTDGTRQEALTKYNSNKVIPDLYNRGLIQWDKESKNIYYLMHGNIWSVDKNGLSQSALTQHHDITSFKLSPNFTKIVFFREKTKNNSGIFVMNTDLTNEIQLAKSEIIFPSFDWSGGDSIIYSDNAGIKTINASGLGIKTLFSTNYLKNEVSFNRGKLEAKQQVFSYIKNTEKNIPVIYINKTEAKQQKDPKADIKVTDKPGYSAVFSKDGKFIYYVENYDIYSLEYETGKKKKLTSFFKAFFPAPSEITDTTPAKGNLK
jgi:Tol biopolymer transport system component